MKENLNLWVKILKDKNEELAIRDDIAMDLSQYNYDFVLDALIQVSSDPEEDKILVSSAAESIAEIWVMRKTFDIETYNRLLKTAKNEILGFYKNIAPELLPSDLE